MPLRLTYIVQIFTAMVFIFAALFWWLSLRSGHVVTMWANLVLMGINGALFIVQFQIRERMLKR